MQPETQKRILDATSELFNHVGNALGFESVSYEDGIRVICEHGNKTLNQLALEAIIRFAPTIGHEQSLTPDVIPMFLVAIDTREKAEAVLSQLPEPDPRKFDKIMKDLSSFLPSIRKTSIPVLEKLPWEKGRHKKKNSDPHMLREEIAEWYRKGLPFPKAKAKVAKIHRMSLSTINRRCKELNLREEDLVEMN